MTAPAPALAAAIRDCADGGVPAPIAAMRLLVAAPSAEEGVAALERAALSARPQAAARLAAAAALLRRNGGAFAAVRGVLDGVRHDGDAEGADPSRWAAAFDRAARVSPEAGVALYSLGSPDLLRQATQEVVAWMRERRLIGPDRRIVDLGCGIGRFEEALAAEARQVTGLDVSGEMLALARERCRDFPNVAFVHTAGRDLAAIADESCDLLLAVDSFPYLVLSGLAETHLREAARVLAPGGSLLILNYSYRADPQADRRDLLAAGAGLTLVESGMQPFSTWDGMVHHLARAA